MMEKMTTEKIKHSKKELLWGRIAAKTIYFMLGAGSGTFAANIPRIKDNLHLSPSALGLALLCCSAGGFIAMQFAAPLIKRFGLRALIATLAPSFPLVLILIAFSHDFISLAGAFILFGGLTSIAGIAVNGHAIDIEKAYAKTIMSSFHALFSIGGLVGATAGGMMAAHHLSVAESMTIVALGLSLLGASIITKLFDVTKYDFVEDHEVIEAAHKHHKATWWRQVLLIGGLMFICFLCEGAIADWSAIYMKDTHHAGPVLAVLAYMVFNSLMTIGRLAGDPIIRRFGPVQTLIAGGIMGVAGLSLGLLSPTIVVSLIGFGIIGAGLSVLVPILVSMAGNLPGGDRNVAIARVSTFGSVGLMTGPAVIGFIAQQYSLLAAMMLPVFLLAAFTAVSIIMYSRSVRVRYQNLNIVE
jgi:MFS family permease